MPRLRVIVLDQETPGAWRVLFWADVPTARQPFYTSTGISEWKGALSADNTAIQNGAVVERGGFIHTPGFTPAQLQTMLETRWQAIQDAVTARNPWNRYGSNWDGIVWTSTGVA